MKGKDDKTKRSRIEDRLSSLEKKVNNLSRDNVCFKILIDGSWDNKKFEDVHKFIQSCRENGSRVEQIDMDAFCIYDRVDFEISKGMIVAEYASLDIIASYIHYDMLKKLFIIYLNVI